ncbi:MULTISPECIES: hypothetical protein [Vibrio]|uniref:hypothetical protein n=1 Tax=Vibrio TaxID=662 RepID=UPI000A9D7D02|nr:MULTISPECIES: hypothetical protein [Vibrio]
MGGKKSQQTLNASRLRASGNRNWLFQNRSGIESSFLFFGRISRFPLSLSLFKFFGIAPGLGVSLAQIISSIIKNKELMKLIRRGSTLCCLAISAIFNLTML